MADYGRVVMNSIDETNPNPTGQNKPYLDYILIAIQILAFAAFISIALGMVFAKGVCCGDDGFHAHVAKNLADGIGYASTLPLSQSHFSITPFDPLMGTGPTIILPTALVIKIVGNTYWAPGLAEVLMWGSLLFCIGILLNKMVRNRLGVTIATVIFLYITFTFMAYQYEMWYALYGEIPAVMLIILAILIYFRKQSRTHLFICGILFSLAYESKLISLLPFGIFLFFITLYQFIDHKKNVKDSIKPITHTLFFIALGFGVPVFLYESWKLIVLHPRGYLHWWKSYLLYVLDFGGNVDQPLGARILERILFAEQRFGIFLPAMILVLAIIGYLLRKQKNLFPIFLIFGSTITVYFIYWVLFSLGWARYLLIPLTMMILVLIFPFLASEVKKSQKIAFSLILIGLSIYNVKTIKINHQISSVELFKPSAEVIAQQKVADILSAELDRRPFYTQWWGFAVDVEYIMDTHLNFSTIWDPELDFTKPIIVVVNNTMLYEPIEGLSDLLSKCKTTEIGNYTYAECPALISR